MKIPYGKCQCGCGGNAPLAPQTTSSKGYKKGEPMRFIHNHHQRQIDRCRERNSKWKGGRKLSGGYVWILMPAHPRANSMGYVQEHILVVERVLGKTLPLGAVPHHRDGNGFNNAPSNLVICQDNVYHLLLHMRERALMTCGHASWRKCKFCKKHDAPQKLKISKGSCYHRSCHADYEYRRTHKGEAHGEKPTG